MYNFSDLIARSYLNNKETNEVNIAQVSFKNTHLLVQRKKSTSLHKQFIPIIKWNKMPLTIGAAHNRHINSPDFILIMLRLLRNFQQKDYWIIRAQVMP
jgi:hypothetical protein